MISPVSLRLANFPLPEQHLVPLGVAALLHRLRPQRLPLPRYVRHLAGWPLLAGGVCLAVWATGTAGDVSLSSPTRLVRTGPYAFSRNPMYLAWSLLHLGAGLVTGSASILETLPLALVFTHRQIQAEEQTLSEAFGAEFAEYKMTVPRYFLIRTSSTS
jgi:protein-S-isoprenylcysteine O-methyltransferase Ste14